MTSQTRLVPIRIAEIRSVVICVALGPQAGRALAHAAVGQRQGVYVLHLLASRGQEGNHLAIDRVVLCTGCAGDQWGPVAEGPVRPLFLDRQHSKGVSNPPLSNR